MSTQATHATKVISYNNRGCKAQRATCSCGWLGTRFAYLPASIKKARAKAEADAAEHAATN